MSDDAGRTATYAAEDEAFGGTELDADTSLARLATVAADLTSGEWWRACGGPVVRVAAARVDARSSSARDADAGVVIRLAAGQQTLATLTHELAHALVGVGCGHDARFRAAHADVVAMVAGADHASELVRAYAETGVPAGSRQWPTPVRLTGTGFLVVP